MKLKEFVKQTLYEIVTGVEEAQSAVKETNAEISPTGVHYTVSTGETVYFKPRRGLIQTVEFDVAVTTAKGGKAKAGIGLLEVLDIGVKADVTKEAINRVKFTVPVLLPSKPFKPEEEKD